MALSVRKQASSVVLNLDWIAWNAVQLVLAPDHTGCCDSCHFNSLLGFCDEHASSVVPHKNSETLMRLT